MSRRELLSEAYGLALVLAMVVLLNVLMGDPVPPARTLIVIVVAFLAAKAAVYGLGAWWRHRHPEPRAHPTAEDIARYARPRHPQGR